jgi:hypothetical protein
MIDILRALTDLAPCSYHHGLDWECGLHIDFPLGGVGRRKESVWALKWDVVQQTFPPKPLHSEPQVQCDQKPGPDKEVNQKLRQQ